MSLKKGIIAEDQAVKYLIKNNFEIIERNFHSAYGEIDIIAKKNSILHFIEVKSGSTFNPAENLTNNKLTKILKTVDIYICEKSNNPDLYFSIDLIVIDYKDNSINFIENITL
jgi:putative endonuclease